MSRGYWDRVSNRRLARRRLLGAAGGLSLGAATIALVGCGDDDGGGGGATGTGGTGGTGGTAATGATGATGTTGATGATGGASGEQPRRGGRFGTFFPGVTGSSFNPLVDGPEENILSGELVYDKLISGRPDERVFVLEAAEGVEQAAPDQIVVTLRSGLVYQDKQPVGGRAVRTADLNAQIAYIQANPQAQKTFHGKIANIETPDERTLIVNFTAPYAYAMADSGLGRFRLIPEEMFEDIESTEPVGSGPYQLDSYNLDSSYLFTRFDGYRDADKGLPYIDERRVFLFEDDVPQETTFRSGDIHSWANPDPRRVDSLTEELGDTIQVINYLDPTDIGNAMMTLRPPFDDERVRHAVYRATNREQIIELIHGGRAQVTTGLLGIPFEPYQLEASETEDIFRFDPDEARKLLDAAAFPFGETYRSMNFQEPIDDQQNEVWAQQLREVGIEVLVTPYNFAEALQRRREADWELYINLVPSGDTPEVQIRKQHSDNLAGWPSISLRDPEIDALIEQSEQTLDLAERVEILRRVQLDTLGRYTGYHNLWSTQNTYFLQANVRDFEVIPTNMQSVRPEMWLAE